MDDEHFYGIFSDIMIELEETLEYYRSVGANILVNNVHAQIKVLKDFKTRLFLKERNSPE